MWYSNTIAIDSSTCMQRFPTLEQAVGIFGHMTSKNPLDSQSVRDSTNKDEASDPSDTFEQDVNLQSVTNEIEKSLEDLGQSIEESIHKSAAEPAKEPEPPHFTVASSPTRRTHKDN